MQPINLTLQRLSFKEHGQMPNSVRAYIGTVPAGKEVVVIVSPKGELYTDERSRVFVLNENNFRSGLADIETCCGEFAAEECHKPFQRVYLALGNLTVEELEQIRAGTNSELYSLDAAVLSTKLV